MIKKCLIGKAHNPGCLQTFKVLKANKDQVYCSPACEAIALQWRKQFNVKENNRQCCNHHKPAQFDIALEALREGLTVKIACERAGISVGSFAKRTQCHPDFKKQVAPLIQQNKHVRRCQNDDKHHAFIEFLKSNPYLKISPAMKQQKISKSALALYLRRNPVKQKEYDQIKKTRSQVKRSDYTPLLKLLQDGVSLTKACQSLNINLKTLYTYRSRHHNFNKQIKTYL